MEKIDLELVIAQRAGIQAAVQIDGEELTVSGFASTEGEKQAALQIVEELAPNMTVVDDIAIMDVMPSEVDNLDLSEADTGGFTGAVPGTSDTESLEPGDFTDQETIRDPTAAAGPSGTHIDDQTAEGDEVYVPPTDPVRRSDNEVLGGFQTTAMDDDREPVTQVVGGPADVGIVDAVLLELRQDAATTHLDLRVSSMDGVVRIRGFVQDIEDAENAEEVAARVPGVVEVIDETQIRRG